MNHRIRRITIGICCAAAGTAVTIVATVVAGAKARRTPDLAVVTASADVQQVAAANTTFAFNLIEKLTADKPGTNVFVSPYSVTNAMSLALNGAGGDTYSGIEKGLGLGSMPLASVNRGNSLLLPSLENPDPQVELDVANAIWARRLSKLPSGGGAGGGSLSKSFTQRCETYYDADASTLDFGNPSSAASTINAWVRRNTQGKIDSIVAPSDLVNSTAVLTNAVYFHGKWTNPFQKENTQTQPFNLETGARKPLPLMSEETIIPYLETSRFQAVSLPYGSGRMSFYVLLPKHGTSLGSIVKDLNARTWTKTVSAMKPVYLTVMLPRFEVDYKATLNRPLIALGMGAAFDDKADFKPMGLPGSAISAVYHKALIQVDEEGTVAAAATGTVMQATAMRMPATIVRVDHPFFCAIRDNATGTVLFAGAIYDPKALN